MKRIFWNITALFFVFFILTFEFEYSVIPNFFLFLNPFFESLVSFSGTFLFGLESGFSSSISSDSIGLYLHVFNLILISVTMGLIMELMSKNKKVNLRLYLLKIMTYYLSLQLLIYGLDKVFKAQFFLPEPNTLFTPLKDLSKDILYWSTIGVSRSYSLFLGMAEVLTALFLLFKKTRLLGIIMGVGILINVVAINFSFDISVKVYSLFLLAGFIVLLTPYFGFLHQIFIQQKPTIFPVENKIILLTNQNLKKGLKRLIITLIFVEGLFPFVATQNFNDDNFPRPKFHGAYEVKNSESEIETVFVHRRGYLIFKNKKDEFQDFQLELDSINYKFLLFNYENKAQYELSYLEAENKLIGLKGAINGVEISFELEQRNLDSVPLFENKFHWTTN